MERHTITTIIFGVCFIATAIIALPLSFIAYISASVTIVVHYLFVQWLISYVENHRRQCDVYMLFAFICIISATTWSVISHSRHGMNDETKASLGFLIPSIVGVQLDMFVITDMKLRGQTYG